MPIYVAAVGISDPDERLLAATLASLSIRTDEVWKQAGGASADILVVDLRSPEGAAAFEQRGISPDKVFIALASAGIGPAGIGLTSVESTPERTVLPLRVPLQAAELSGALESAEKVLVDLRAGSLLPGPASPIVTLAEALRDLLVNHKTSLRAVQITDVEQGGVLFIFFPERTFFLEGRLSSVHGEERVRVSDVPRSETAMVVRLAMAQPLTGLLGLAGLSTFKGTLLPRLDPAATYRLTHWPTMEMLGAQPALLKVAAYLIKRVGTFQEVAARTGLVPEHVADAFNACALHGFLEVVPREHVVEQSATPRVNQAATPAKRGLFQRIRAKLGLAS